MDRNEILARIDAIIAASVNHNDYTFSPELRPAEVKGWDSLANAMILTAIENECSIKFKFADMVAWKTIGELADIIVKKRCAV